MIFTRALVGKLFYCRWFLGFIAAFAGLFGWRCRTLLVLCRVYLRCCVVVV